MVEGVKGIAAVVALVCLCAVVFGELFFMRTIRRLVSLMDLFARGDFSARSGLASAPGEIGVLARSFDALADAVVEHERSLQRARQQLEDITSNLPGVIYQFAARPDGSIDFLYVSERSHEIFGIEHSPKDFFERFSAAVIDEDRERFLSSITKAVTKGTPWHFEGRMRKPHGAVLFFTAAANPQRRSEGLVFNGVIGDATERKQAVQKLREALAQLRAREEELTATNQELTAQDMQLRAANQQLQASFQQLKASELSLRESEARFRAIAENTPDVILTTDTAATILFCNNAAEKMFGFTKEEMIGRAVSELLPPWLREREQARRESYIADRTSGALDGPMETIALRKDGTEFPVEVAISPWETEGAVYYSVLVRDISLKKKAEAERSLLITAVEQADEIIMITDNTGTIHYVNHAFVRVTGYGRGEVIGRKPSILKSGKQTDAFYRDLWETITQGNVWQGHFINKSKDGSLFEEDAIITPLRDAQGRITNFVAVKRDVTQKMKLERQYRQAQKMEAIGTLAGGIAHDFNNILSVIYGYVQMGIEKAAADADVSRCLRRTLSAAERAQTLVRQILTFSRHTEQERRPLQIASIIKETCKFLRASLPTTIDIRVDIRTPERQILGDPTQVQQILMNLCTNAHHAMRKNGGVLEIVLDDVCIAEGDGSSHPELKPGAYVRLSVGDTGCGIDPDNLERIFDPYFTTKEAGEGTGLGLSVVLGIVKDYGGDIRVASQVGRGTTFDVYFPCAEPSAPTSVDDDGESLPGGNETILFIDDEPFIAESAQEMLESIGYTVKIATDAQEGLDMFEHDADAIALVITDKTMPGCTGFVVARTVKAIKRDMPVILCTGFKEQGDDALAAEAQIDFVLSKPLKKRDMAKAIRKALDENRTKA